MNARAGHIKQNLLIIYQFLFFALITFFFIVPISDPDFPWHLMTGEFILEEGVIPTDDPFLYTTEGLSSTRERFILSQYWLGQAIIYLLYKSIGILGLCLMNAVIFSSICLIIWTVTAKKDLLAAYLITCFVVLTMKPFTGLRPHVFTFLFTPLVVLILDRYVNDPRKNRRFLFFLPLIMVAWANMHGGFIFGDVVIVIISLGAVFEILKNPAFSRREMLFFYTVCLISILISAVNPNGFYPIQSVQHSELITNIAGRLTNEYVPLIQKFYGSFISLDMFLFWLLLAYLLMILALATVRRKIHLRDLLLSLFALYIAFKAIRFLPLFILSVIPVITKYKVTPDQFRFKRAITFFLLILLIPSIIIISSKAIIKSRFYGTPFLKLYETVWYPENAANFIIENNVEGRIFHGHAEGGYLNYRLFPGKKLFSDSRELYRDVQVIEYAIIDALRYHGDGDNLIYALVNSVPEDLGAIEAKIGSKIISRDTYDGPELWKEYLDKYQIDIIIHKAVDNYTGGVLPFVLRLAVDDEWELVYFDTVTTVFVRNIDRHKDIIRKYRKNKSGIYDALILQNLGNPEGSLSTIGYAFIMKGYHEAGRAYTEKALQLAPQDIVANFSQLLLNMKDTTEQSR